MAANSKTGFEKSLLGPLLDPAEIGMPGHDLYVPGVTESSEPLLRKVSEGLESLGQLTQEVRWRCWVTLKERCKL